MNTQSNPRPCEHSMVTDLCGICVRDEHIKDLIRQRDDLLYSAEMALSALSLPAGRGIFEATETLENAISKAKQ